MTEESENLKLNQQKVFVLYKKENKKLKNKPKQTSKKEKKKTLRLPSLKTKFAMWFLRVPEEKEKYCALKIGLKKQTKIFVILVTEY